MKLVGIVSEYNPFHNGHAYQIAATRRAFGDACIVAVMSGNFVQRGEPAILDKFTRAELAVRLGADLVLELPMPYAVSSAEFFARGAVSVLSGLGSVEALSFGSECGDIDALRRAAAAAHEAAGSDELRKMLSDGISYPAAIQALVKSSIGDTAELLSHPNNLLGIEYIKAVADICPDMQTFTVKRRGAAHDSEDTSGSFASASKIRGMVSGGEDFSGYLPPAVSDRLAAAAEGGSIADIRRLERIILYRLRTISAGEAAALPDVSNGLHNRLLAAADCRSYKELIGRLATKRYPAAKWRRIIINMLVGVTKKDLGSPPPYIRVLALNRRGREALSLSKRTLSLPCSTSIAKLSRLSDAAKRFAKIEALAGDIYALSTGRALPAGLDYTKKITITE